MKRQSARKRDNITEFYEAMPQSVRLPSYWENDAEMIDDETPAAPSKATIRRVALTMITGSLALALAVLLLMAIGFRLIQDSVKPTTADTTATSSLTR